MILNEFLDNGLGIKTSHAVRCKVGKIVFDKFVEKYGHKPAGRNIEITFKGDSKPTPLIVADYPPEYLWDNAIQIFGRIFMDQNEYFGKKTILRYNLINKPTFNRVVKIGVSKRRTVPQINEYLFREHYLPAVQAKQAAAAIVKDAAPRKVLRKRKRSR